MEHLCFASSLANDSKMNKTWPCTRKLIMWWDSNGNLHTSSRAGHWGTWEEPFVPRCGGSARCVPKRWSTGFKEEVASVLGLKRWFKVLQESLREGAFLVHARDKAHAKAQVYFCSCLELPFFVFVFYLFWRKGQNCLYKRCISTMFMYDKYMLFAFKNVYKYKIYLVARIIIPYRLYGFVGTQV